MYLFIISLLLINPVQAMTQAKARTRALPSIAPQTNVRQFNTDFNHKKMPWYHLSSFENMNYGTLYSHLRTLPTAKKTVIVCGNPSKMDLVEAYCDHVYDIKLSNFSCSDVRSLEIKIKELFQWLAKSTKYFGKRIVVFIDELDVLINNLPNEQDKKNILTLIHQLHDNLLEKRNNLYPIFGVSEACTLELYKSIFPTHIIIKYDTQTDHKKYLDYHFKRDQKPVFKIAEFNNLIAELKNILSVDANYQDMLDLITEIERSSLAAQNTIDTFYLNDTSFNIKNYASFSMCYKRYQEMHKLLKELIHHENFPSIFREIMREKLDSLNNLLQNYFNTTDTYLFKEYYFPSIQDFEYILAQTKHFDLRQIEEFARCVYGDCLNTERNYQPITKKIIDENIAFVRKYNSEKTENINLQQLQQHIIELEKARAEYESIKWEMPKKKKETNTCCFGTSYTVGFLIALSPLFCALLYGIYENYDWKKKKKEEAKEAIKDTQIDPIELATGQ